MVFQDWRAIAVVIAIGVAVGVSSQLNWIQLKCEGQPFFTLTPEYCGHNLARVLAGGPLAIMLLLFLTAWLRRINRNLTVLQCTFPALLLLPMTFLPITAAQASKQLLTTVPVLLFLIAVGFVSRRAMIEKLAAIFAKPAFGLTVRNSKGMTIIHLTGNLIESERDYIFDCVTDLLLDAADSRGGITVNVTNLQMYHPDFRFIFHVFLGWAAYAQRPIFLQGESSRCKEINLSLNSEIPRVE